VLFCGFPVHVDLADIGKDTPPLRTALDWGMVSSETASVRVPIPRDYLGDEDSMLNSWIAIIGAVVVAIQRIDDYFKQQDINGFGK
jgi:hypothetical protein